MWFGGQMVFAGTLDTGKLMTYFTYITQIMVSPDDGVHGLYDA